MGPPLLDECSLLITKWPKHLKPAAPNETLGTPVAVQQKTMRHADIRATFNLYGNIVTDEITTAGIKVSELACGPGTSIRPLPSGPD